MKSVTTREFFEAPGLVKSLQPGQSLLVTDKGAPAFTVIKTGKRRAKTWADLKRESAEISAEDRPKVNFTAAIKRLKQR